MSALVRADLTARAALRTGFYAAATAASVRLAKPLGEVERDYGRHALRDAYDLHRNVLSRPGMRDVLRRAEREDLATLPFFLASLPFDLVRVVSRTRRGIKHGDVSPSDGFPYPDYYLNDFHHQVNGNLSLRAALTYEWQIRFLFMGTNRLMRQILIDEIPVGDDFHILDVGCGTASWLTQARLQGRRHRVTGIDLSPHYLGVARAFRGRLANFHQMNAESLDPKWSNRFDAVTCIWMFHEMPPGAIENATAEIARVLKPGGTLYFMDAAQPEDIVPEGQATAKGISERFRDFMNEPYFRAYQAIALRELFDRHGLAIVKSTRAYASKVVVASKEGRS
jgi:ubiquinone/menaquinone biosynthesis C-methylase UbiE